MLPRFGLVLASMTYHGKNMNIIVSGLRKMRTQVEQTRDHHQPGDYLWLEAEPLPNWPVDSETRT